MIKIDYDPQVKLLSGTKKLYDIIKYTFGISSKNILIGLNTPHVTDDGITVAKFTMAEDELENQAIKLLREASANTNEEAGDGTSTAIILATKLFELISGKNYDRAGILKDLDTVVAYIKKQSIDAKDYLEAVATIAAKDPEIGKLVAETVKTVRQGIVTVERNSKIGIDVVTKSGYRIDHGFMSTIFADDQLRAKSDIIDVPVLITTHKINNVLLIDGLLKQVIQGGSNNLIIFGDCEPKVLEQLVALKFKSGINITLIKVPSYELTTLEDISVVTGAPIVHKEAKKLNELSVIDLGTIRHIEITSKTTTIIENKNEIIFSQYVAKLQEELKNMVDGFEKSEMKKRIAKLSCMIAVIKVGCVTETESTKLGDKIDDSVRATQSAMEEGVVVGGGVTLLNAIGFVKTPEMKEVLKAQFLQLVENGNRVDQVDPDPREFHDNFGFNFKTRKFENLLEAGVIDSAKVLRVALQNGVTAALTLASIAGAVVNEAEIAKK